MSWSHLRDAQGFGMQCASYISGKLASCPGIMALSRASWQPFPLLNGCFDKSISLYFWRSKITIYVHEIFTPKLLAFFVTVKIGTFDIAIHHGFYDYHNLILCCSKVVIKQTLFVSFLLCTKCFLDVWFWVKKNKKLTRFAISSFC
jgi:hypothetical protein